MRTILALFLAALPACASGSSVPASAGSNRPERVEVEMPGADGSIGFSSVDVTRRGSVSAVPLALGRAEAWPLLLKVYTDLGLPVNTADRNSFTAGVTNARIHRIAGKPIRAYFDCGLSYVTGGRDVYVLARTQLSENPAGGTLARTQVEGFAKSNEGSGGTRCASTGALESLIEERLREAVQARSSLPLREN